jgi:hypothetical protein
MTLCQVDYVNEISDTSSVYCVVVISKHIKVGEVAAGNFLDVRHQVVWDIVRVFTDKAGWMSSDRVEIS